MVWGKTAVRPTVAGVKREGGWSSLRAAEAVQAAIRTIRQRPEVAMARLKRQQQNQLRRSREVDILLDDMLEGVIGDASTPSTEERKVDDLVDDMLEEVIGDASSPSTAKEVDNLISEMLKKANDEVSQPPTVSRPASIEWMEEEPLADPRLQHLMAIQLLNSALDKAEDDPDTMCVLRGVDGKGELLPLSTPTYAGEKPRILAGGRERLLLYSALATASVWDGQQSTDAPPSGDTEEERRQWAQEYCALSPRQRRRRRKGATRITMSVRSMLDSGASQNFVSQHLVKERQLRTLEAPEPLQVTVADGAKLTADRVVHLTVNFPGYSYTDLMYVLPLGVSATVILGAPFLEEISPFICDMRREARTISFRKHGRTIRLEPSPEPRPGVPVISLRRAMLDMRVRRRLLSSAGEEAALAYLCVLLPTKEGEEQVPDDNPPGEAEVTAVEEEALDVGPDRGRPQPEPPPEGTQAQATAQAVKKLQRGLQGVTCANLPAQISREIRDCLRTLHAWDGKGEVPKAGTTLIRELELMGENQKTMGESFWTSERRRQVAKLVEAEFDAIIKEDLPIREGPEVDFTKAPAAIRFKDSYAGETPSRPGIKMSPLELAACREILLDLLHKGYIRPSSSPFGAPILMVPKPGQPGKLRMVVDYRALNLLTQADRYPLPTIDGLLQQMAGARVFSTMDLLNGFWQMPLLEEHRERTAMTTTMFGSFEWNVLPMGLKNSPAIFQRNMAELFRDLDFVSVYIDDIVVYSATMEEHTQHLRTVLRRLQEGQVCVKQSKSKLFRTSVHFLGHLLSGEGVAPQAQKVEAIAQWPTPKNLSEVRSFLGLASFYRKYVHHFASIAAPLHQLSKQGAAFQWREDHEDKAFRMLKQALTSAPLLVLPDVERALSGEAPYLVQCDASLSAWGAVLMQDQGKGYQPIAFVSKSFNAAQMNYSATERELQALVSCTCEEWRHYLFGMEYLLQGDHRPLAWLMDPRRELSRRQARWITQLMENNVPTMTWVPGKQLVVPDALSRRPDLMTVAPPRAGIRMEVGDRITHADRVDDPEDSLLPVNPLRDGYMVPANMAKAPRAVELQVDEGSERAVSTAATLDMLREAEGLRQDGAGYREILEVCLMDGQPTESEETPTTWIPIRAQHGLCLCLPAQGAGSPEHAFETLCWLATGQGPLSEAHWDGGTSEVSTLIEQPKTAPLWEAMCAMEEALVADNVRQWTPEAQPSEHLLRRDQADWSLTTSEFNRWHRRLGPYDVDACTDPQGRNRQPVQGDDYWHDCLSQRWDGRKVWVHPPFEAGFCRAALTHYQKSRDRDSTTMATFVLPSYLTQGELKETLQHTDLVKVHTYDTGTRLFRAADGTPLPARWKTEVWHGAAIPKEVDECHPLEITPTPPRCNYCHGAASKRQGTVQQCLQCETQFHRGCRPKGSKEPQLCDSCEQSRSQAIVVPRSDTPGLRDVDNMPLPRQMSLLDQVRDRAGRDSQYQEWTLAESPSVFRTVGDLLWRVEGGGMQLVIPNDRDLKDVILQECHSSAAAGHLGTAKTFERVTRRFWWAGVRQDVLDFVLHCDPCQRNKHRRRAAPQGLLRPVTLPSRRFEVVSLDFVTGLPMSEEGHNTILTITDKFSRLVRLIAMRSGESESSAEEVARIFVDSWWRCYGMPAKVISDRDVRFTSRFWTEFLRLTGSKAAMTTSYHPQGNGQAENTNQLMETVLRAFVEPRQTDWSRHLSAVEFAINDSVHSATGYSPFQLVYGESPLSHLDLFLLGARREEQRAAALPQQVQLQAAERFMDNWRRNLADARTKMEKAQLLQKHYYDAKRKQVEFQLNDRLLVSKKHLTLPADRDLPWKLRSLWEGPYRVIKVLKGEDGQAFAYKLELPVHIARTGLHDVFTADRVIKYRGDSQWPSQQTVVPTPEVVEGQREHYVEKILRHRDVLPRGRAKAGQPKQLQREYLVKWEGLPLGEAQWRTTAKLNRGGVLKHWRDYEEALMSQDPQLASEEAKRFFLEEDAERGDGVMVPYVPRTPDDIVNGELTASTPRATSDVKPTSTTRTPRVPEGDVKPVTRRSARLADQSLKTIEDTSIEELISCYEEERCEARSATYRALVLFSGSGSVEEALRYRFPDIEIVAVDIDPKSSATRVCDIRQFVQAELFEYPPGYFDVVWASPPCTEYSRALTTRARDLSAADLLVAATLACLVYLKPRYWFIENPDGLLRTRPIMLPYQPFLHPVSYCRYGTLYRKHTCIWSNAPHIQPERCTAKTPCAAKAKWGYHPFTAQAGPTNRVPGSGLGKRVYAIPQLLLRHLFTSFVM